MGKVTFQDNNQFDYDQWLFLRNKTIGASEVGPIVHGSRWTSSLEIFYNKVTGSRKNIENIRTYLGKKTENVNRQMYCFYDGTDDSIFLNERAGKAIKEVTNNNYTYFNSDYPHLSCTPDGDILPALRYAGRKGVGSLELKNSQRMVLNSYEGKLPTDNIFQVVVQMMVPVREFADLFFFLDNRSFEEHHFERKEMRKMEEVILLHTVPFWENVLKARPLYNQMYEARRNFQMKLVSELEFEIAALEPPAQNTAGHLNYLTQRYKDRISEAGIIPGTNDQLLIARKYKELAKKIDKLEAQKRETEIQLKEFLKENVCLDFGQSGKVTWYPNKNGDRKFSNNIK